LNQIMRYPFAINQKTTTADCLRAGLMAVTLACLACISPIARAQSTDTAATTATPTGVVVKTKLGGFILGFDIDRNGTDGVLAESLTLPDGKLDVAVETFDQKTGKILKTVSELKQTDDDFVALGIVGTSVGLVEEEIETGEFVTSRVYEIMDPVSGGKFTGTWTPPFTASDIISVPFSQGSASVPVFYFDNGVSFRTKVISTNFTANTFGKSFTIPDPVFNTDDSPVMAYDSQTNQAVLGGSNGCFGCTTEIGLINITTGAFTEFEGLGFGFVNGIAVDPETGIAVTATEDDASVEFYDLATQTGKLVVLPGAEGCLGCSQAESGGGIAFDPMNKLFLVGQTISTTASSGSSIQVFNEQGDFVESINGLSLPAGSEYIALQPKNRTGYVIVTPALTELQQFTY